MRILLFLLFPVLMLSQKKIKLELKQQHEYCGGARPNPELLAQYEKPLPYAGKKLIMVSSDGKIDTLNTDHNGKLSLKLRNGTYKFYEYWRYYKKGPDNYPVEDFYEECLKKEWEKPEVMIIIKKRKSIITVNIDKAYCPHTMPCLKNRHIPE